MEIDKYVIGGVIATVVIVSGVYYFARRSKPAPKSYKEYRPDLDAFKRSMEERYNHPESITKINATVLAEIIKGVHYNINNDIKALFPVTFHIELMAYNDKLLNEHTKRQEK
jgi:hypothetical protein